ncbi:NuA4-domain-containing protein [Fomitopsis serialis]|uniref:NuA4-domain-containing protein n=1 Tax=Fomitopsis serialis TaxID=139415 RepID=UPI00200745EA|nr:NuA4-domain-containing protein [Neoantrodia serialis]KAH9936162.1 NuA4-domain-containing protein [Neoantrodia serialis]
MASDNPSPEDKLRYDAAKKELLQALSKRRNVDKQLSHLEVQIYNLEASYLTDSAAHSGGNILHGFEGYLKNPTGGRKKYEIHDNDRMFSNSSTTYKKSLELSGEGEESGPGDDSRMSTPGLTTVIVPPAPRNQELTAAQQKKNRDREYQRKKRASARATATPMSEDDSQSVASSGRRPTKRARLADDD